MIKVIAFITMILDHIGVIFFPDVIAFRIIGRFCFPLFAWGIARGYKYTRNYKIYALRLLALAAASQIPYYFLFRNDFINICFTLLAGLIALKLYDSSSPSWIRWTGITFIALLSQYLHFEYGFYGVLTILFFYLFWSKDSVIYYQAALTLVCTLVFRYDPIQLVAALSPILILLLQSKDYRLNKVLQYGFYPAHLLLLILVKNGGLL